MSGHAKNLTHHSIKQVAIKEYALMRLYEHLGRAKVYKLFGVNRNELEICIIFYAYCLQVGRRTGTYQQVIRTTTKIKQVFNRRCGWWLGATRKGLIEPVLLNNGNETSALTKLGVEVLRVYFHDIETRVARPYQARTHYKEWELEDIPFTSLEALKDDKYNRYVGLPGRPAGE